MRSDQNPTAEELAYMAGRATMLQALRDPDDHPEWWTRVELREEISDIDPAIVDAELAHLAGEGAMSCIPHPRTGSSSPAAPHETAA